MSPAQRTLLSRARPAPLGVLVRGTALSAARRLVELGALEDRGPRGTKSRCYWITVEGLRLLAEELRPRVHCDLVGNLERGRAQAPKVGG